MHHYLKKNIENIQGAGFGGKKGGGGSPPPAELQPPKLGKLQTLSSYSYAEIIDLVGDGPLEGLVNKNGQYIQGNRIFEGIYFDNTPIKKSFDISYTGTSVVEASGYSLTGTVDSIYNRWFSTDGFVASDFTGVGGINATGSFSGNLVTGNVNSYIFRENSYFANNSRVNDPYTAFLYAPVTYFGNTGTLFACPDPYIRDVRAEIMWTRDDIAKSIYKSIDLLKDVASSPSTYGESASDIAAQKILRFNYQSWTDVKNKIIPYPVNMDDDDYPVFAVKFNLGSPYSDVVSSDCGNPLVYLESDPKNITVASDFELTKYTNSLLLDDISNQVSQKVEIEDIQTAKIVRPIQWLDLTYLQKTTSTNVEIGGSIVVFGFKDGRKAPSEESIKAIKDFITAIYIVRPDNEKYNYNNVLAEIRNGSENQAPLSYFNRIYIDKEYGVKLPGPFDVSNQILRVTNFDDDTGFRIQGTYEFPLLENETNEGSSDTRGGKDFSSYAGNSRTTYIEEAVPITHVVENPNVDQVFITIGVRSLNDTNQIDSNLAGIGSVQAGARIPTAVRFKVEIGLLDPYGKEVSGSVEERIYQIVGLVDAPALVDIGREEVSNILNNFKFIKGTKGNNEINASTAIYLPDIEGNSKRFVRVTRTTYETSSVLVRREISLEKVTEIINTNFSYPRSGIIGIKIDSRNLSAIPPRNYDMRLKRVMVPSNYFPLAPDGKDKRRYRTSTEFDVATLSDLQIYKGNWDGTFKEAWTDNPAWVLFDMLTNTDYGLGNFIEPTQINIWELYKIGRFCDAVDKDGVFYGVDNTFGGKEPRYSINIIMADKVNVFDTINAISSVFRGNVFYSNSFIDFTDDRIKIPVAEFSNINVKEGTFSYTNSRKDEEFNVIEVSYLDENDEFKPKIEYVENSDDIRKRGILRTSIDSFGVTSKAMANRIGKHILYSTTNENQAVSFIAGNEALFLKPGNLIKINDELKTLQRNFGRVLDIDPEQRKVLLNEKYSAEYFLNEVTLFAPIGKRSYEDLLNQARVSGGIAFKDVYESDVPQIQTFKITGYDNSPDYGSYAYISPQINYPIIRYTGESGPTGLYSGSGTANGYTFYTGIQSTTVGHRISRDTSLKYIIYNGSPDQTPPRLDISFYAIEEGQINFNFNGSVYTTTFTNGSVGDGFVIDISSMTSIDEMASSLVSVADGLIPLVNIDSYSNTASFTNFQSGASSVSAVISTTMVGIAYGGGGYGIDGDDPFSGDSAVVDDFWSVKSGSGAIASGSSGLSEPYFGVWTSGGCNSELVADNTNLDFLYRVKQGSPYGISVSGLESEVYKVTSIRESNSNEYEIAAIKFNTGKFAEIESSQTLDDFYSVFSYIPKPNIQNVPNTEETIYNLSTPVIASFQTGNYDGENDTLDISSTWSGVTGATSYFATLISPNGQKTSVSVTGTGYMFNDQSSIGFYRLNLAAKNQSLGFTSRTATSGINVYYTNTYITPYIKSIILG